MANQVLIGLSNGDEQLTINCTVATDAAPFVGYHLVTYGVNPAPIETARNSSLYVDGSTIVNYKAGNVVETIVLDIVGSTPADAYDKLRALYRLTWSVRDYHTAPNSRIPSHIWASRFGAFVQTYAVLFNAQVDETTQAGRASVEGNRIRNVTVTIEREPYWRDLEPTTTSFAQSYNFVSGGNTAAYSATRPWGALPFNGLAGGLEVPAGDVPALVQLSVTPATFGPIAKAVFGYVSQKRNAIPGYTIPTAPMVYEAEAFTIVDATHASTVSRASASPYTSFGTTSAVAITTAAPLAIRLNSNTISMGTQACRAFVRMKVATPGTGTTVAVRVGQTFFGFIGPTISVDSTVSGADWRMYDAGVIVPSRETPLSWASTPFTSNAGISIYTEHLAGTGTLEIDCLVLIPCDEYYVEMSLPAQATSTSAPAVSLNNIMVPNTTLGQVNGTLYIPPGKGVLYYLTGYDNFGNFWDGIPNPGAVATINLFYSKRYGTIRGT